MDRDEALRLLRGGPAGIGEWNQRRWAGEEIPDLRVASLEGAALIGADLTGADLTGAALHGADLNLADLATANLSGADLTWAYLIASDLTWAKLGGANLEEAVCLGTIFADVDLSDVKGLDKIKHAGPSTVGIDTLVRSQGKIPEAFLRGCGVPDALIAYLPSLIGAMSPIQFYSCFISHSSQDADFATRLHSRMEQEKLRVWYAPEDMRGGRKSIDQIDQAIRVHDKLLLVLSKASMASEWVKHEVIKAVEREKTENRLVLFPISLISFKAIQKWTAFDSDIGRDLAKVVRDYHIPNFSKWKDHNSFETAFADLLRDLKAEDSTAK